MCVCVCVATGTAATAGRVIGVLQKGVNATLTLKAGASQLCFPPYDHKQDSLLLHTVSAGWGEEEGETYRDDWDGGGGVGCLWVDYCRQQQ